ncbi:hypothetical protein ACUNFK_22625 [Serratia sp. IR-2025]
MTLTTELLNQIKADIAARKAMPEYGESVEGNIERLRVIGETRSHFSTETVDMLVRALEEKSRALADAERERDDWVEHSRKMEYRAIEAKEKLANREAQPVYQYRMRNPYNGQVTDWETIKPEQVDFILKETIAANVEFRIIAAPPAPAVPDALANDIDSDDHPLLWSYNNGWNACRAAMLAQPVSSGYTFNSPVIPDGWKLVPIDPTKDMLRAGQSVVGFWLNTVHCYSKMLAAAPAAPQQEVKP